MYTLFISNFTSSIYYKTSSYSKLKNLQKHASSYFFSEWQAHFGDPHNDVLFSNRKQLMQWVSTACVSIQEIM